MSGSRIFDLQLESLASIKQLENDIDFYDSINYIDGNSNEDNRDADKISIFKVKKSPDQCVVRIFHCSSLLKILEIFT